MTLVAQAESLGRRQGRRWRFASAVLDEARWTLSVDGVRVPIEAKPLELLHELLLNAGDVVTKDQLLDAVWPGLSVVEASLPTAVNKLRRALGDETPGSRIIETVSRIGYRLVAPVDVTVAPRAPPAAGPDTPGGGGERAIGARVRRWPAVAGGVALALMAGAVAVAGTLYANAAAAPTFARPDVFSAIRTLDVGRIEAMLRAGWKPDTPVDAEGNTAMTFLLNVCEWNPGHDRARLLLLARTLIDGGARIDVPNRWGDTAYSIAKAERYCGPSHPVTRMMYAACYSGPLAPRDRCLATYELARRKPPG